MLEQEIDFELIEEESEAMDGIEDADEILRQCYEEGKPCSYGICDECPYVRRN